MKKVTSPYIIVRRSSIHSRGIFAKTDITKGTRIIEYVGERVTKVESERRADIPLAKNKENKGYGAVYIFELNKKHDIDGNVPYNTARLINHSCDPNCESEVIRGKIWIIAIRDIKKGDEIVYNYNYGYDAEFEDHPCYCGSERCIGFILAEEHWWKLKRRKTLEKKRKEVKKG